MRRRAITVAVAVAVAAVQLKLVRSAIALGPRALFPLVAIDAMVVSIVAPWVPLLCVLPATYAYWRVGPAAINLSVADAALLGAVAVSMPLVPWRSVPLRRLAAAVTAYAAILLVNVTAAPSAAAAFEWAHRILLVFGAVCVGAALAHRGLVARALRWFVATSAIVALGAIREALSTGFDPAYPFGIHKNAAGALLAIGLIVLTTAPTALRMEPVLTGAARVTLLAGLMATQSRGAMAGFIVTVVVWAATSHRFRRTGLIVVAGAVATAAVLLLVTDRELSNEEGRRFSGIEQRFRTNNEAMAIWRDQPWTGAGIRYFRDPEFGTIEPHNLVVVTLAETGVVGLAALAVLFGLTVRAVAPLGGQLGSTARLVFFGRTVESMFGIFWVAGAGAVPWVLIGCAVGAHAQGAGRAVPVPIAGSRPSEQRQDAPAASVRWPA